MVSYELVHDTPPTFLGSIIKKYRITTLYVGPVHIVYCSTIFFGPVVLKGEVPVPGI